MSGKFIPLHASRVCLRMPDNIFGKGVRGCLRRSMNGNGFLQPLAPWHCDARGRACEDYSMAERADCAKLHARGSDEDCDQEIFL